MGISISIKGLQKLNENYYKNIIIKERRGCTGDYGVNIKGQKENISLMEMPHVFQDDLKGKTEEEKIKLIVESFLRNTKLTEVNDRYYMPYYEGSYMMARGNRELCLQIFNPKLKNLPSKILTKYMNDRLSFIEENSDINKYEIYTSDRESSYKRVDANFGSYVSMTLYTDYKKFSELEREFLKDFIYEKLCQVGEEARFSCGGLMHIPSDNIIYTGFAVVCGDFSLQIPMNAGMLKKEVQEVVVNYNKEVKNAKKMQLKLEGF